ncbi:azurin [Imhoffiella purpurea]|nr:azurin [Imhoffiella purpurea]
MADPVCDFTIEVGDAMRYSQEEMVAGTDCERIRVTLVHTGTLPDTLMGQNWVLARTSDLDGVAIDGMRAGAANDFVKPGDGRVLAATELIGGGESTSVTFDPSDLSPDEDYSYFCTFPATWVFMQGRFILR